MNTSPVSKKSKLSENELDPSEALKTSLKISRVGLVENDKKPNNKPMEI